MARIRTIKPDFFFDDVIAELCFQSRLAFIGLWCHADKAGRMEDNSKILKAKIFPYDKIDFDKILSELSEKHFIHRYYVDGKQYIQIRTWEKHQKPHHTEHDSDIPPFDNRYLTVKEPLQDGEKKVGMDHGSLIMDQGIGMDIVPPAGGELFLFWISQPSLIKHQIYTKDHEKAEKEVIKIYPVETLKGATKNYSDILGDCDKYFYTYKHGFDEFFRKGAQKPAPFKRFLPEAEPLLNLLRDKNKPYQKPEEESVADKMEKIRAKYGIKNEVRG